VRLPSRRVGSSWQELTPDNHLLPCPPPDRWFPPVIRKFALVAIVAGGSHGFLFSYAARHEARDRAEKQALLGLDPELISSVLPTSVERAKEDENETRRTLAIWTMAAEADAKALKAEVAAVPPSNSGWRGWFSSGSSAQAPQT
jgi:hypothetical protein